MTTAAGRTAIEIGAECFGIQAQSRRTTIDHAADGRAMAFAECGDSE
jgi:hypothetical protein